jgi:hypothetical protein
MRFNARVASTHEKFGTGRRRGPVVRQPLHPVARSREEVLRGGLHEVDALGHRQCEEPDEAHVVVQRQPRDHHVVVGGQLGGDGAGVDVGAEHPVGDHHALRLARRTARVLQDHQPFGVVRRYLQGVAAGDVGRSGHDALHRQGRRIALDGGVERCELVVDQDELGVTVADPGAGRVDEHLERAHPHRQRQHHRREARHPAPAHDRHQVAAGRTEDRDVIAGNEAARLERGADGTCIVVDLTPADLDRAVVGHRRTDEGDRGVGVGGAFEPDDGRQFVAHPRDASPRQRVDH